VLNSSAFCADAGASDAYACNLTPAITAYVTGTHYRFKANTVNTGAATINLNSVGAITIKKAVGGITTDLADNDIRAGQWVDLAYDGTNMQMQSTLGNAASGSGTVTSSASSQYQTAVFTSATNVQGAGPGTSGYGLVSNGASAYPTFQAIVNSMQFDANPALTGVLAWTSGVGLNTSQSGNTVTVATNNATSSVQGTVVLTGDFGGTATAPQVVGINGVGIQRVTMTADWTCGTGGTASSCSTATIVGTGGTPLTITLPSVSASYHWQCDGVVGQATAATANNWNVLTATNAPTNLEATFMMNTAAAATAGGALTGGSSTSTQTIGGNWTLGGTATKMPFHIQGSVEGASASGSAISLQLVAPTVADLVTIYRGATCSVTPF
jgi:hypothetical protein